MHCSMDAMALSIMALHECHTDALLYECYGPFSYGIAIVSRLLLISMLLTH